MAADRDARHPQAESDTLGVPIGKARTVALADLVDRVVAAFCRFLVLVTGIALTVILSANVGARYVFETGGFRAAQELPERIFPWFIVGGIVLATQAGGHMAVEWLPSKLGPRGRRNLLLLGNAIIVVVYTVLLREALRLADIASAERSPVLGLSGSHGYWSMALGLGLVSLVTITSSIRISILGPEAAYRATFKEI
ncbi:TRAP transporter small permease subunit [Paracoccus sp. MC1854]|uniref:TRAP transporter small permease n=1 Tax=Paracoccus sp. MC1854 TaxID=2760306 RepID=UPI00160007B1|nr:TRAP transporter small permease subunit [Paracoccus sp. MC1854]MBB1492950.1 TRAP transporter small permease subunit [Paracoccus sp. MC1854]